MAFRRGGSSIVFQSLQRAFLDSGLRGQDLVADRHFAGITAPVARDTFVSALATNELLGCFREPPETMVDVSEYNVRYVLLTRDPRDCDISWYYARHLHAIRNAEYASLRAFLEQIDDSRSYQLLMDYATRVGARVFRYEDVFRAPSRFLADVFQGLDFPITQSAIDIATLLLAFSRMVTDNAAHNRSGLPFQSFQALPDDLHALLTQRHKAVLLALGYPLTRQEFLAAPPEDRFEIDSLKRYMLKLAEENGYRVAAIEKHEEALAELKHQIGQIIAALRPGAVSSAGPDASAAPDSGLLP